MNPQLQSFKRDFATMTLDPYFAHCQRLNSEIREIADPSDRADAEAALKKIIRGFPMRAEVPSDIYEQITILEKHLVTVS